ncbi:hypothetical protein K1719_046121 [Acacia pycnantha]|nr:hypothetical protein K1719_046121 [Acacia pycnantha]
MEELYQLKTYHEVVDEIYNEVDHVEPWMTGNCRGPSSAFCLLYKFFTMKLTVKQMHGLLKHPDSPYIRAIVSNIGQWFISAIPVNSWNIALSASSNLFSWYDIFVILWHWRKVVGGDLLSSNAKRIERATIESACNGFLLKVNQVGTVTEIVEVVKQSKDAHWGMVVSHRCGETVDSFMRCGHFSSLY